MTKKPTPRKQRPKKRGPKEERLVIKDPQKVIDSLFPAKPKKNG
jgi:hypothetical protein